MTNSPMQQLALGSVEVPPAGFHLSWGSVHLSHTETVEFVAFFWITPCIFLDNAFHFFEDVPVVLVSFVLWDSVCAPRKRPLRFEP